MKKFSKFVMIFIVVMGAFCTLLYGCGKQEFFTKSTYVTFGDSITASRKDVPISYTQTVGQILKLKDTQNNAVSGATLKSSGNCIYDQIAKAREDADIVSLLGGVNDYSSGAPLGTIDSDDATTIYGALNKIVTELKNKYQDSFIFLMTPLKCYHKTGKNSAGVELLDVVNAVKAIGNKYSILVLDLYNDCDFSQNDSLDKLHPKQEFVSGKMSTTIANFIRENYKEA